jgi:hypothetical protein
MKIIGFSIKRILAEVKENQKTSLEVISNLNLEDLKESKIEHTKQQSIIISFNFYVDYKPNVAKIEFKGRLILLDDENKTSEIIKAWKQKKLPEEIKLPILNYILEKCNIKSLGLEEELGLPLHIPLPKLSTRKIQENPEKIESEGKKPASYAG